MIRPDIHCGPAHARTEDVISVSGGTAAGLFTPAIRALVQGGFGIYGSEAGAGMRAYLRLGPNAHIWGETMIFSDRAFGEENYADEGMPLPPTHVHCDDLGNDARFVDIQLDGNVNGILSIELSLDVSAFGEGDWNTYRCAPTEAPPSVPSARPSPCPRGGVGPDNRPGARERAFDRSRPRAATAAPPRAPAATPRPSRELKRRHTRSAARPPNPGCEGQLHRGGVDPRAQPAPIAVISLAGIACTIHRRCLPNPIGRRGPRARVAVGARRPRPGWRSACPFALHRIAAPGLAGANRSSQPGFRARSMKPASASSSATRCGQPIG